MGKYCPYCGRRISYFTTFHEKKRGIHTCTRCKKESKIKTDFRLIIAFIAVVLIVLMFMVVWTGSSYYNNFLGVIITAAILTVFYFCTPLFIRFVPLKKYRHHEVEREEFEYEYEPLPDEDDIAVDSEFTFNRDIFDQIKEKRNSNINHNNEQLSDNIENTKIAGGDYVPIIKDVTEAHASSSDAPLKRVNTNENNEYSQYYGNQEYYDDYEYTDFSETENFDDGYPTGNDDLPDGSKYTANRRF